MPLHNWAFHTSSNSTGYLSKLQTCHLSSFGWVRHTRTYPVTRINTCVFREHTHGFLVAQNFCFEVFTKRPLADGNDAAGTSARARRFIALPQNVRWGTAGGELQDWVTQPLSFFLSLTTAPPVFFIPPIPVSLFLHSRNLNLYSSHSKRDTLNTARHCQWNVYAGCFHPCNGD